MQNSACTHATKRHCHHQATYLLSSVCLLTRAQIGTSATHAGQGVCAGAQNDQMHMPGSPPWGRPRRHGHGPGKPLRSCGWRAASSPCVSVHRPSACHRSGGKEWRRLARWAPACFRRSILRPSRWVGTGSTRWPALAA